MWFATYMIGQSSKYYLFITRTLIWSVLVSGIRSMSFECQIYYDKWQVWNQNDRRMEYLEVFCKLGENSLGFKLNASITDTFRTHVTLEVLGLRLNILRNVVKFAVRTETLRGYVTFFRSMENGTGAILRKSSVTSYNIRDCWRGWANPDVTEYSVLTLVPVLKANL